MKICEGELTPGYDSHATENEHAHKHIGDIETVSRMRAAYLELGTSDEEQKVFQREVFDRIVNNRGVNGELVTVSPKERGGRWLNPCAYALTRYQPEGDWSLRETVEELLVLPEHRNKGLATWILGRLSWRHFGVPEPSPDELILALDGSAPDFWLPTLEGAGFRRFDEEGNPLLWLPAHEMLPRNQTDVERLHATLPEDWSGVICDVADESDENIAHAEVYHRGQLIGDVSRTYSEDWREAKPYTVKLVEPGITYEVDPDSVESMFEIYVDLLNHPSLIGA